METENQITIAPYQPGDPSLVCYFYYRLFAGQYGFNGSVEKYFIKGMGELFDDPEGSQLWTARDKEEIIGSIAIIKKGEGQAQLRWFGVSEKAQGTGIGNLLLKTAMDFCRSKNYTEVILWTIEILKPARHLYAKYGFVLKETKPNYEWSDHELTEEKWEYHAGCKNN